MLVNIIRSLTFSLIICAGSIAMKMQATWYFQAEFTLAAYVSNVGSLFLAYDTFGDTPRWLAADVNQKRTSCNIRSFRNNTYRKRMIMMKQVKYCKSPMLCGLHVKCAISILGLKAIFKDAVQRCHLLPQ